MMGEIIHQYQRFDNGDRVFLKTDPAQAPGTVVDIVGCRYFVQWDLAGRTWIYAGTQLELAEDN